jgi:phage FluMu protein Com
MPKDLEDRIYDLERKVDALELKVSDLRNRLLWVERKLATEEYGAKTGYTTIRCKTCGRVIARYKGHIGLEERMRRIRRHYKTFHPKKWKEIVKKSVATRLKRRKKSRR